MPVSKKLIFAFMVICTISTSPLLADLNGLWEGEGKGVCYPPFSTPYAYPIYAWQLWNGTVEKDGLFYGEWKDEKGNYGRIKGEMIPVPTPDMAIAKGVWTWYNIFVDPPEEIEMGDFNMTFHIHDEYCEGKWWSYTSPTARPGTMWGKRIGD